MLKDDVNKVRTATLHNVLHEELHEEIAWDAVWHFFVGGDEDFTHLYERRLADTHIQQDDIYLICSEILFEQEMYIASLLDESDADELAMVIHDLSVRIKTILQGEENGN